jgi:hypothetical protein
VCKPELTDALFPIYSGYAPGSCPAGPPFHPGLAVKCSQGKKHLLSLLYGCLKYGFKLFELC